MQWFMEAEGSRNYEDEATMNELLRKLDTNGDGKVAPQKKCHVHTGGISSQLCRLTARSWLPSSSKSRRS